MLSLYCRKRPRRELALQRGLVLPFEGLAQVRIEIAATGFTRSTSSKSRHRSWIGLQQRDM